MQSNLFGFIELMRGRFNAESGTMIVNLNNIAALLPIYDRPGDDDGLCMGTQIVLNSGASLETSATLSCVETEILNAMPRA